jgi:hypothetical protein
MKREAVIIDEAEIFARNGRLEVKREVIGDSAITVLTVDDFYRDPDKVRDLAFVTPATRSRRVTDNAPIARSEISLDTHLIYDFVVGLIAREFGLAPEQAAALEGRDLFVTNILRTDVALGPTQKIPHFDQTRFAAQVYLNTPEECRGGTGLYRHRATGLERYPITPAIFERYRAHFEPIFKRHGFKSAGDLQKALLKQPGHDDFITDSNEEWELIHLAEMKYNRLIVYEGNPFHSTYVKRDWFVDCYRLAQLIFL